MAENDMHYNGMADLTNMQNPALPPETNETGAPPAADMNGADNAPASGMNNTPVIPLPTPGEGEPAFPGGDNTPDGSVPVIPLPDIGEGGPVFPGNQGGGSVGFPGFPTVPGFPVGPVIPDLSPQFFGQVRFLNASANQFPVTISIDGNPYAINSRFGTITNYDWVSDGFHTVTVRRSAGMRSVLLQQNFPFVAGQKVTMVLTDSAMGGLDMIRVVDTGCRSLPYNSGCYRFANMTYAGSRFDLLLQSGETVFRSVGFQSVTAYKQAAAGSYRFLVTNSNSYTFLRELPIIVIGAAGSVSGLRQPLLTFTADIGAGQNYTTYLIGNTWSDPGLQAVTVED